LRKYLVTHCPKAYDVYEIHGIVTKFTNDVNAAIDATDARRLCIARFAEEPETADAPRLC